MPERQTTSNPYTQLTNLSDSINSELDEITNIVTSVDNPMLRGITDIVRQLRQLLAELRNAAQFRRRV